MLEPDLIELERYATYKLMGKFGSPKPDPALVQLVEFHDQATHAM